MWAQYSSEFFVLALVHFLAVILPGPDFIITVRNSLRYGCFIGMATALGIGLGISIHVFYTLVGLGFVIQHSPWFMFIFRVLGALYLIYLGWILLKSKSTDSEIMIVDDDQPLNTWNAFRMGVMTNVLNPKATIFSFYLYDIGEHYNSYQNSSFLWDMDVCSECLMVYGCSAALFLFIYTSSIFEKNESF